MLKTTVYLSEELKRKLAALARRRRTSEAHLIREGLELRKQFEQDLEPLLTVGESKLRLLLR